MATYYNDQTINNEPGHYYVSVIDGPRSSLLLGPFDTHMGALLNVEAVRREANRIDTKACFYGFGTASVPLQDSPPQGRLNDIFAHQA